jgi:branched-subunit amino acid aminotransferase/4-amino-4-deoxychorismate lyase
VLARRHVVEAGGTEGIYVSETGRVLEGVTSNVFVAKDGTVMTPPLSDCLPGITRGRVLELAAGAGFPTRETALDLAALMGADEVFITNAVQGLRLVETLDGRPVGRSGATTSFDALRELYERDRLVAAAGAA